MTMSNILDAVTMGPKGAEYSVIWLHGLGADGHDFESIVPELDFKHKSKTRFVFPHAPKRPVTINNGYVMPAWYDIIELAEDAKEDEQGIRGAEKQLQALISQEHQRGVTSHHIVLAGFSQGGAIVLHTGLRYTHRLAGIMALSTYLPLASSLETEASRENKDVPIFMAHGEFDPVVPIPLAQLSKERLIRQGYNIDWRTYPMEHSVIPQEINDISAWLESVLN